MKIRCPRCQSKISVPDEWAGKSIRCSGCNKAFAIPKPVETGPLPGEKDLDLESLAKLEARSGGMESEELAAVEAEISATATEEGDDPNIRICPHCNKAVPTKDPYMELLCSNCWKPIPALRKGAGFTTGGVTLVGARNLSSESKTGFYEGIGTANVYPIGAMGSILLAMGVAVGTILFPVSLGTAFQRTTEQASVGIEGVEAEKLTGVEFILTAFFWIQVLFFAGVGLHAFIEVTRTTGIGEEQPPPLVWNPAMWGESIIGYVLLLAYFGAFFLITLWWNSKGEFHFPTTVNDFKALLTPGVITTAGILTFFVPMTLIGLSVGKTTQAFSPVRVLKSIAATHINYVFLFLLVAVYASMFFVLFSNVLIWFSREIRRMQGAAVTGNLTSVALGLLSWGMVMGIGIFFMYVLGRIHGLFARAYRKQLEFAS